MTKAPGRLDAVQQRIGYVFGDTTNLRAALTHSSAVEASQPRVAERLEFLGDAVLGLAFGDLLLHRYPGHDEGQLSKFRAALISTTSFAAKARALGLHRALTLGKGEEKTGGREKASILAAVYEAVMGAIFLESGYQQVRAIVARHFSDAIDQVATQATIDPKTQLQELCQQLHRTTPVYRVVGEAGPDHARRFVVDVLLKGTVLARGAGRSKRSAEQEAARRVLEQPGEMLATAERRHG
ncbi:MAG: ribonuclease III [Candidatus Binatia bacterium]